MTGSDLCIGVERIKDHIHEEQGQRASKPDPAIRSAFHRHHRIVMEDVISAVVKQESVLLNAVVGRSVPGLMTITDALTLCESDDQRALSEGAVSSRSIKGLLRFQQSVAVCRPNRAVLVREGWPAVRNVS